jgi:uncharacterized protein YqhQ
MEYNLDQVNLQINEATKDNVIKFNNEEVDSVVFKILSENFNKAMFILVHGNKDGLISINNTLITATQLLESFIRMGLTSDEIDNIYTISCYGGLQESTTINGITISSVHDGDTEVYYRLKSTKDDTYWLTLYAKEDDYEGDR